jgi:Ca2+-binding RTX toxin-like protein
MALPILDVTSTSANETFIDYEMDFGGPIGYTPPPTVQLNFAFNAGFGQDTIVTNSPRTWLSHSPAGWKYEDPYTIKLGEGIRPADVVLARQTDVYHGLNPMATYPYVQPREDTGWKTSWTLSVAGTADAITVLDFFFMDEDHYDPVALHTTPRGLLSIEFADGTVWLADQVQALLNQAPQPLTPFNELHGTDGNDAIVGYVGRDTIYGGDGNDLLDGAEGRDVLWGGAGNDTLRSAGEGDVLHGGADDDVYELFSGSAARDSRSFFGAPTSGPNVVIAEDPGAGNDTVKLGLPQVTWAFSLVDGTTLRLTPETSALGLVPYVDILGFVQPGASGNTLTVENFVFGDGSTQTGRQILAKLTPAPVNQTLVGTPEGDLLTGADGNDQLSGLAGNDTLVGGYGQDTLSGGQGKDLLLGGQGADTFNWSVGDGWDTVSSNDQTQQDMVGDVVNMGVKSSDAVFLLDKQAAGRVDVIVALKDGSGGVEMVNAYSNLAADPTTYLSTLPTLKFSDGVVVTGDSIASRLLNNVIAGSNHTAWATSLDGSTVTGGSGADLLYGLSGNDTVQGGAGADTLRGGQGNDLLVGGKGADTYLYARGDGQDTLIDTDSSWFVNDTLKLADITSKQLWFARQGNDLDIQVIGSNGADDIHVQNWFGGTANRVERIMASDGKTLTASKVQGLVNAMATLTPPATADISAATTSTSLNKLVTSSWV